MEDDGQGKLLVLRIGGKMAGDAMIEFSVLGKDAASRVIQEAVQWYNPERKN